MFRKIVSFLLVAVMLLQIVSPGGVVSARSYPYELLNMERQGYDDSNPGEKIANVRHLLEEGELLQLPQGYATLSEDQKNEIARGMIMLIPLDVQYDSDNQAVYAFNLIYNVSVMPGQFEIETLGQRMEYVYNLLGKWNSYFPGVDKAEWTQAASRYMHLNGADWTMFIDNILLYNIVFKNSSVTIYHNSQLAMLYEKLNDYKEINKATDINSMNEAIDSLFIIYLTYLPQVGVTEGVRPFVFNMNKMFTLKNDDEKNELAQWMLDHKQDGYETVSDVQKAFDAFFEPGLRKYNELIKEAKGNANNFIADAVELLSDKNFIATPDFKQLSSEDQNDIAVYILNLDPPTSEGYANKAQVEYLVQLALKAVEFIHDIGGPDEMNSLDELYTKQMQQVNYLDQPAPDSMFYQFVGKYSEFSGIEKRITAAMLELQLKKGPSSVFKLLTSLDDEARFTPLINKALTTNEMLGSMFQLRQIQSEIADYNKNLEHPKMSFPIDVEKIDGIKKDIQKSNALADHMIAERPDGGYESFVQIQTAFDKFFSSDNNTDVLSVLNAARKSGNKTAMREAMEDPALEIKFPDGYENLNPQVRDFIAGFLIQYVSEDYENKNQVQLMIELGMLAQSVWEQTELTALSNKLDLLAQKMVDISEYFNDQEAEEYGSIGQKYLKLTNKVDKNVFAYKYLYSMAYEKLEGLYQGDIVEPMVVLGLLTAPYQSIEKATKIDPMSQWLQSAMEAQMEGEAFFDKYNFNRTGALDLSKRAELSVEDQKELAQWVLDEQDSYEDIGNLQYVINRFFTAPNVKGDDVKNEITGLNDTMEISFDGKLNWIDLASIQKLDFSGNKTVWVRHKAFSDELPGRAVKIIFTANGDSGNGNGSTPNPGNNTSGNGGGGSSAPVTSTPAPTTKQEQIVVDVNGVDGTNLTKTPITRTTETNGTVKDLVKMTDALAKESVEKAKQLGSNTARIVIPDTKDAVSETRVEIPKTAVKDLSDGSMKLEISTENAIISIPTKSIAGFDQDLYFRVVPLKKESERKDLEERAKKEQVIQQVAPNTNVRVLARPVEIETNMQSREVTLTLPLGNSLPTDAAARQQILDNLAVYIEHSDGTKELLRGKLVKLANNSEGIEFTVTKFSTFTLVVVDGLKASQKTNEPYIQGFGADFRPDAFVTRAQMAAMLARNLPGETATATAAGTAFADVAATHWATSEIQKAQAAGIMNGLSDTAFAPEGSITRAQMATIAYRWLQKQQTNAVTASTSATAPEAASFTDVAADLWAADAIAYVQSTGLMTGYNDGTFKPDNKLTRAEAVKVLNVLFKRTPLTGVATPSFSDVPATHWAYADIEAAAQK
ncbi:S-layer homology domain-containing protein [Paenibacillus polysaccharolyticus]|uniref:S-layer homology domain-containing protein n=1 Tax=Paenibacillus polysaccharolyticus TaxID=582692 RepID=A0A1G5J403_9BACL|nr:S-layer homology domain-containing protein [Paenibacillus polysaccharolyticus]SCY82681.1 S-layer homology domain-containing protein [Paenibacillus polysaccharolyticus]